MGPGSSIPAALMLKAKQYAKTIILAGLAVGLLYAIVSTASRNQAGLKPAANRKPAPDFTVTGLNGTPWRLADHRGDVVLLNFWATWCPPCREETPGLVHLANSFTSGGFSVVGISMDDGAPQAVREFASQYRIPYTIAMPPDNFVLSSAVQALPTTLLIDKQGRVAKTYVGGASESVFRADVESLLREQSNGD